MILTRRIFFKRIDIASIGASLGAFVPGEASVFFSR